MDLTWSFTAVRPIMASSSAMASSTVMAGGCGWSAAVRPAAAPARAAGSPPRTPRTCSPARAPDMAPGRPAGRVAPGGPPGRVPGRFWRGGVRGRVPACGAASAAERDCSRPNSRLASIDLASRQPSTITARAQARATPTSGDRPGIRPARNSTGTAHSSAQATVRHGISQRPSDPACAPATTANGSTAASAPADCC